MLSSTSVVDVSLNLTRSLTSSKNLDALLAHLKRPSGENHRHDDWAVLPDSLGDKVKDREKEKERGVDKEARQRLWREKDNSSELIVTRMIVYLTATSSEDRRLVLEVCRKLASETNAKEAVRALRKELKYAEPKSQLSAARLLEIMLRNASDTFLTQISSRKFIDTLEDVLTSTRTCPVVRNRLMKVLAVAAFTTSSRTGSDGFRDLWIRLKHADKPHVGISFDTDDATFSLPIVPHQRCFIPPEDMKLLFQQCKIAMGNATVLSEMLARAKPEQIEGSPILDFLSKCDASQELIATQIPWASEGAERSRNDRKRNAEGNRHTEQQTMEEELLDALVDANEALLGALNMYDNVMRVAEEQVTVDIVQVSNDVEMDRRHNKNEYLEESHHDYGGGYSRRPSPSPPTSPRQTDLPLVIPSQTHPLPRIPLALSPTHSHYDSPPQFLSTSIMPARPPPPMGPRSSTSPSRLPASDRGGIARPCGNLLELIDCLHTDSEEEFPIRPSVKALRQRRVVKEVDDGALCSC
ncbi:hypothetical protein DFJ58DRAFT_711251 [Suillus subalutaceus]|uniref:uncharacterized protein n=1 Tax=Suillus subalutaceus TaxID=48586 RepID=UPI001B885B08|nr:uncharacterized protein DFJ58DRAFT_711251 [Suillus subalutaceus]KAG1830272.1 hypothetical protein DFJ58DRAFT_711251 [Suillus subalutaceus]